MREADGDFGEELLELKGVADGTKGDVPRRLKGRVVDQAERALRLEEDDGLKVLAVVKVLCRGGEVNLEGSRLLGHDIRDGWIDTEVLLLVSVIGGWDEPVDGDLLLGVVGEGDLLTLRLPSVALVVTKVKLPRAEYDLPTLVCEVREEFVGNRDLVTGGVSAPSYGASGDRGGQGLRSPRSDAGEEFAHFVDLVHFF